MNATRCVNAPKPKPSGKRGPRGGVYDPFPIKLHRMLDECKAAGLESVVSWLEHGRAFRIHQPKLFAATIMCRFFNQSKYTSFQRQLNLYGFSRCIRGPDSGAYYHGAFLRGEPALALSIIRTKIKGNGHKTTKALEEQPDFYKMVPLKNVVKNVVAQAISGSPIPTVLRVAPAPVSPTASVVRSSSTGSWSRSGSITSNDSSTQYETTQPKDTAHLDEINQSIFIHELAMGCTILCKLRKDDSKL